MNDWALETQNLGKRYQSNWALQDCSLRIETGRIIALVGPNGAGKTTLLHLLIGLLEPTVGSIALLNYNPRHQEKKVLPMVGFVDQGHPLYHNFKVAEMLTLGRKLNQKWDGDLARQRLKRLGISLSQVTGKLSGGQQAQVSLIMALAKHPKLLILDEPLASLDPLARREFMQILMEETSEGELTVILSSHNLADLERACDYLLILSASRLQLAGDIEKLVQIHKVLIGPRNKAEVIAQQHTIVQANYTDRQSTLLVKLAGPIYDPAWHIQSASLEEIVLAYLEQAKTAGYTTSNQTLTLINQHQKEEVN